MSEAEDRKELHWLRDMRDAIAEIEEHPRFSEGKAALDSDKHYRVWVLYHMERIGECASALRREHGYDTKYPDVDCKGTQGMRRRIVHTYWQTDYGKVWQGVEYLPKIKEKLNELIPEKERSIQRDADKNKDNPRPKIDDLSVGPDDDEVGRKRTEVWHGKLKAEAETREIKVPDPSGKEHTYSSKSSAEDLIMLRTRVNSGVKRLPGEEKRLLDIWIAAKQKDKPAEENKKKDKPHGK